MKKIIYRSLLTLLTLFLCLGLGTILLLYSKPMKDFSLDLSLMAEDGAEIVAPEDFDNKGWTIYTQELEEKTLLEPDGVGGYIGIEPGQTFYFSRTLSEKLDSPTLQISTVNRQISVWLEEHLIYTDCPELDNRIGMVTLPMHEWDRSDPVIISLPPDYQGKTLTIAQSTPEYVEGGALRAYPCSVMLYCGYAYESTLIAESYTTAIFAAVSFIIGVILLLIMIYHADISYLFLSVIPFLWMVTLLMKTSFFYTYFASYSNTPALEVSILSTGALLIFLLLHAGKYRIISWSMLLAYLGSAAAYYQLLLSNNGVVLAGDQRSALLLKLPYWLSLAVFISIIAFGILFWRKEKTFYQTFCWLAPVSIGTLWGAFFVMDSERTLNQILLSLGSHDAAFVQHRILWAITFATLLTGIIDALKSEINHRAEKQLAEERRVLTLQSYENLRLQHQEIMMLRHDMAKHFSTLKNMSTDTQVISYLEELLGQNQKVRPIVQTGNQILDIILNSRLSNAVDKGIPIDIVNASAPEKLPLSDADLCSLVMNIIDNAFAAASVSTDEKPFVQLDFHEKNHYFTFTCKNSSTVKAASKKAKKETVQKHGLGLKIIRNITERYHGLVTAEQNDNCYEVKVAIPLR